MGEVTLNVEPANATLLVDGIRVERLSTPMRFDVGDHVFELRADGWLAERRPVRVQGGQARTLDVRLSKVELGAAEAPKATPAAPALPRDDSPQPKPDLQALVVSVSWKVPQ